MDVIMAIGIIFGLLSKVVRMFLHTKLKRKKRKTC